MFKRITWLTNIETASYLRNKAALFWTFIYPIILLMLLLTIFGDKNSISVKIEVSDQAQTGVDRQFVSLLDNIAESMTGIVVNAAVVNAQDQQQSDTLRVVFPASQSLLHANADVATDLPAPIITVSADDPNDPVIGSGLLLISTALSELRCELSNCPQLAATRYEFKASAESGSYSQFLITGLAALAIITTALFGFTQVLVELRSRGGFKMFQVMPMRRGEYLIAFNMSRIIILTIFSVVFIYGADFLLSAGLYSGLTQVLQVFLLLLLGSASFLAMGLLIAAVVMKTATANAIVNLLNLFVIFLSDLFIPVAIMPDWIESLVHYSPVYLFVNALRSMLEEGASIIELWPTCLVLFVSLIVCTLISARVFKWKAE